jgi:hypothetical protein
LLLQVFVGQGTARGSLRGKAFQPFNAENLEVLGVEVDAVQVMERCNVQAIARLHEIRKKIEKYGQMVKLDRQSREVLFAVPEWFGHGKSPLCYDMAVLTSSRSS